MPQDGYTYDELVKMGAKPGGYSLDELQKLGATPGGNAVQPDLAARQAASKAAFEANLPRGYAAADTMANRAKQLMAPVTPDVLGQRLIGMGKDIAGWPLELAHRVQAAADPYGYLPKWDVPQPSNPNQELGAKLAEAAGLIAPLPGLLGKGSRLAKALVESVPTVSKGKALQAAASNQFEAMAKAFGGEIGDYSAAAAPIQQAQELKRLNKVTIPGPMRGFIGIQAEGSPITFTEGRKLASGAGDLAQIDTARTNQAMRYQLNQFAKAMDEGNRSIAERNGWADIYDAAMKDWGKGKDMERKAEVLAKWGKKVAIKAAMGAALTGGGAAAYEFYRATQGEGGR